MGYKRGTRLQRVVKYRGAHNRVESLWGKASNYPCVKCGKGAEEWAYDGTDELELTHVKPSGYVLRYSCDPEFYMPLCVPCHRLLDEPVDVCKSGHAMTEDNIIRVRTRPNRRVCRACQKKSQAETYQRRKARQNDSSGD